MKNLFLKFVIGIVAVTLVGCTPAPVRPLSGDEAVANGAIKLPEKREINGKIKFSEEQDINHSVNLPDGMGAAYGNIKLPAGIITNVLLYKVGERYAPPLKSPPQGRTYPNGNFFFENLEPGNYFLMGFVSGEDVFYFNYRGVKDREFMEQVGVEVKPGGMAYFGSFEVTGINPDFTLSDSFDIKRSAAPSHDTILTQLKDAVAGTGWDLRIEDMLKK